jgi:hypothetical protein
MLVIITHDIPDAIYPLILEIIDEANVSKSNFDYTYIFLFGANEVVEQVTLHQSMGKIATFNSSLRV